MIFLLVGIVNAALPTLHGALPEPARRGEG